MCFREGQIANFLHEFRLVGFDTIGYDSIRFDTIRLDTSLFLVDITYVSLTTP